jgi:hypothetical protein
MFRDLEHPEITWAERTGYPSWNQPKEVYCDRCGDIIDDESYEDEHYDCLCLDCLMKTHLKEV